MLETFRSSTKSYGFFQDQDNMKLFHLYSLIQIQWLWMQLNQKREEKQITKVSSPLLFYPIHYMSNRKKAWDKEKDKLDRNGQKVETGMKIYSQHQMHNFYGA